ncbi:fatty acid desaturase family protein [Streptomyces synnematoformans]|uniref:Fatty acid desaturase domain-containing protein n=1 Tax=Streptomyces synnematoformans TaxID=415721 RepID=A0ABP5IY83_9ACTN
MRRVLGRELVTELEALCGRPTVGMRDVVVDLAAIAAAASLGTLAGHVWGPLLAAGYIGIRQRHLANLVHECVHSKLLAGRRGNRLVGYVLTALLGEGFLPYRNSHLVHHAKLGSDEDPMFQSYRAGNIRAAKPTRRSFVLRAVARNAVWHLPKNAVLTLVTRAPDEPWRAFAARTGLWAGVVAVCWPLGAAPYFLLYWVLPALFVRPVVNWLTDLGNHAGVIENTDPLLQTRGWTSHWLTRHLLGNHLDDMYHPIHHWCPQIPWRRLPEAAALAARSLDRWGETPWCSGFFFRRRSTPDQPCVIEDIVARLNAATARLGAERAGGAAA